MRLTAAIIVLHGVLRRTRCRCGVELSCRTGEKVRSSEVPEDWNASCLVRRMIRCRRPDEWNGDAAARGACDGRANKQFIEFQIMHSSSECWREGADMNLLVVGPLIGASLAGLLLHALRF